MRASRGARAGFLALAFVMTSGAARAQSCSFSVGYTDFGEYDTTSTEPADVVGAVIMYCTGYATPMVRMCLNISTAAPRVLTGPGGATLNYNLYVDPDHVGVWGSVLNPATTPYIIDLPVHPGGNVWAQEPFYGRVPPRQTVTQGIYTQSFSAADTYFVYLGYSGTPPSCSTATTPYSSAPFVVQATVGNTCTISATPMAFGTQSSLKDPLEATSQITATCTSGTSYQILLDAGRTPGNTFVTRRMQLGNGTDTVEYQLYSDPARVLIWGDGSAGTHALTNIGTGAAQSFIVYGEVPVPRLEPTPGRYRDTVTATITY